MTCIIGARGKDGIALISDRLVIRGDVINYGDKIHVFWEENPVVVVAFSGFTGIRDKFGPAFGSGMREARMQTLGEVINGVEDIAKYFHERYSPRLGDSVIFMALVSGLTNLANGKAQLHTLFQQGFAAEVHEFNCIGSAGPYATSFLKMIYEEDMPLERLVAVGGFIIRVIEGSGIDRNVGGGVDAIIIRDNKGIEMIEKKRINELIQKISKEDAFSMVSKAFKDLISESLFKEEKEEK